MQNQESKFRILKPNLTTLEPYRRNNVKVSRIPDSISDKELESSVIKIMKAIDVEVDYHADDDDELFL